MMTRSLSVCAVILALAGAVPMSARATCVCTSSTTPSYIRTVLLAYAGQYDAMLAAGNVAGKAAGTLRGIGRLFGKTEKQVRKAQLLQVKGKLDSAAKVLAKASTLIDKLAAWS